MISFYFTCINNIEISELKVKLETFFSSKLCAIIITYFASLSVTIVIPGKGKSSGKGSSTWEIIHSHSSEWGRERELTWNYIPGGQREQALEEVKVMKMILKRKRKKEGLSCLPFFLSHSWLLKCSSTCFLS